MRENMHTNFERLQSRIFDSISKTDLIKIRDILTNINSPTIISGVGGSSVVSTFFKKVLSTKNNIICDDITPRDLLYKNINFYDNIIACSYSGNNYGVDLTFNNNLNKYLFSINNQDNVTNINYQISEREYSFISLSATLIPMTILLLYYTNNISIVENILNKDITFDINDNIIYEILCGYETMSASKFIESTMVESGIGIPILHDKYDYCHGRTTLSKHNHHNLIHFNNNTELDKLYINLLNDYYDNIILINKEYDDPIINDYYCTYISMLLCKQIAIKQNKDLAIVDYSPVAKKIYKYKGDM